MYTNIADEEVSAGESADFLIAQIKAFNLESEDTNKTLENTRHVIDAVDIYWQRLKNRVNCWKLIRAN